LGDLERQSGNYEASKESFRKALTSAMESYIPGWTGHCHLGLAELALTQRELSVAEESLNLAGEYYKKVEQSWGNIQVSIGRARLALLRNLPEWRDVGRQAYRDSLRLGYERDCRFIRSLLETSEYRENCLMFL
jgi:hypothetical protein